MPGAPGASFRNYILRVPYKAQGIAYCKPDNNLGYYFLNIIGDELLLNSGAKFQR